MGGGVSQWILVQCAWCEFDYTHQDAVAVFDRSEDQPERITYVPHGPGESCWSDQMDVVSHGNPSARRQGVRIGLTCEECSRRSFVEITQHKGCTSVQVVRRPDAPTRVAVCRSCGRHRSDGWVLVEDLCADCGPEAHQRRKNELCDQGRKLMNEERAS